MSQTTPTKSEQFKCTVCKTTLLNAKEFVAHTKTHQPLEPSCLCGKEIPCPRDLEYPPGSKCLVLHMAKCPRHHK
jgi:hypothetical protein